MGFVTVLRFAGVAVHSRRFISDQRFDSMRKNAFALAAPTVNILAWSQHIPPGVNSFG